MKAWIRWGGLMQACIFTTLASAQETGMETETKQQFEDLSKFIVTVMTGPVAKIIALILLLVGIWKIIHKDYGSAVGCVIALLTLVFLPQILNVFGR
ncbi:MAG: hypothetical protein HQL17_03305 [Candidatus Omnitrophica bacterium]|nr:hypothetical protein [Candidatus Omnitrophota bacterium]